MKEWLRFFFGSFFSNKIVKRNIGRSFANAGLALFLALVMLFLGLYFGNIGAFPHHLEKAEPYSQAIQSAFDNGLALSVNHGEATSTQVVNTFDDPDDAGQYKRNDVELIVDTRDLSRMYVSVDLVAIRNEEGITYDAYRSLSEEEQKSFRLNIEVSDQIIDVASFRNTAEAFLVSVTNTQSPEYQNEIANEYRALKQNQSLSVDEMDQQLYVLYARAYYPDFTKYELAAVPTLRDYYLSLGNDEVQYLMIYSEMCVGLFFSEGSSIRFMGYFSNLDGFSSETDSMHAGLLEAHRSAHGATAMIYVINLMQMFLYVVFLWVILAVVVFLFSKIFHLDSTGNLFGDLTVVGCFMFVTSVIAGTAGFVTSFFASREITYLVTTLSMYIIFIIRTLVLLVPEIIRQVRLNKLKKADQ